MMGEMYVRNWVIIKIGNSISGSSSVISQLDLKELIILSSPLIINIGAKPNLASKIAFDAVLKNSMVKLNSGEWGTSGKANSTKWSKSIKTKNVNKFIQD